MKKERLTPILLIIILILLVCEFGYAIYHNFIYKIRVNDGNKRWHQVEEILSEYDERIIIVEELCKCGRDS